MKKISFSVLLVLPVMLLAQNAKIKIDVERSIGEIDPKIYGVFMEPIQFSGRRMGLPDIFPSIVIGKGPTIIILIWDKAPWILKRR